MNTFARHSRLVSILIVLGFCPPGQAADPATPDADNGKESSSKISEVTVYADRAQVTRVASLELSAEPARFSFSKLPGWLDEGSVRVSLTPAEAGEILDVQIRRTFLVKPSDAEFQKAEATVQEVSDQLAALEDEKAVLEAQSKQVDAIRMFALEKLPKDVAVREVKPDEYGRSVEFVTDSLRKIAMARRELDKKRRELQPELNARQRKLGDLRQRAQLEQRTIIVTAKGEAKKAAVILTYMLPGATWEPVHELRAAQDAKNVALSSFAVVAQTTGEDWTGVRLSLSTQRATETLKIPELEALFVGSGRKVARVVSSSRDSFVLANKNYVEQNTFWFEANNGDVAVQQEYRGNQMLQMDNQKKVEHLFEKIQQRGTTAHFPASGLQNVRSDGRQVRVPLGAAELSAQHRTMAAPEVSLNAVRTVDLLNTSKQSLLPGKVSIFFDGAFLGLTETEFVAPSESFALYLGVADHVKLTRTLDRKRSELKSGGAKTKMLASFVVTVENLSDRNLSVQLTDRVPVSQMEEVKVSGVRIQPDLKPDVKGILRWDVPLTPRQSKEFRIEYTLEYPTGLPTAKPAAAAGLELHEQIRSLESRLK